MIRAAYRKPIFRSTGEMAAGLLHFRYLLSETTYAFHPFFWKESRSQSRCFPFAHFRIGAARVTTSFSSTSPATKCGATTRTNITTVPPSLLPAAHRPAHDGALPDTDTLAAGAARHHLNNGRSHGRGRRIPHIRSAPSGRESEDKGEQSDHAHHVLVMFAPQPWSSARTRGMDEAPQTFVSPIFVDW